MQAAQAVGALLAGVGQLQEGAVCTAVQLRNGRGSIASDKPIRDWNLVAAMADTCAERTSFAQGASSFASSCTLL